jgi:hypothetical protein
MRTPRVFILSLLIGSAFLLQAQNKLDNRVLMTIADEQVTVKEFMDVYSKNNVNNQVIDQKSLEEYLDLYKALFHKRKSERSPVAGSLQQKTSGRKSQSYPVAFGQERTSRRHP